VGQHLARLDVPDFTAAIVFVIPKSEARWLRVTMIVSLVAYNVAAMFSPGVSAFRERGVPRVLKFATLASASRVAAGVCPR
jgi:hypothetical protein